MGLGLQTTAEQKYPCSTNLHYQDRTVFIVTYPRSEFGFCTGMRSQTMQTWNGDEMKKPFIGQALT